MALPSKIPDFPDDFDDKDLERLRALTCYAIGYAGYSAQRDLFPNITRNQIYQFLRFGSNLDFRRPERHHVKYVYLKLYEYFLRTKLIHPPFEQIVRSLYRLDTSVDLVLPDSRRDPAKLAVSEVIVPSYEEESDLEKYYKAMQRVMKVYSRDIREEAVSKSGVYILYRYTSPVNETDIVAISLLTIKPETYEDGEDHLKFSIAYKNRRFGNDPRIISGAVVPNRDHLYFVGVDEGSAWTPFLMSTKREFIESKLLGILLRRSTSGYIMASRIVAAPVGPDSVRKDMTIDDIDAIYRKNLHLVDVRKKGDIHEFKSIAKYIDNSVDSATEKALREYEDGVIAHPRV